MNETRSTIKISYIGNDQVTVNYYENYTHDYTGEIVILLDPEKNTWSAPVGFSGMEFPNKWQALEWICEFIENHPEE